MFTSWLDQNIGYDGSQLCSHWIFEQTGKTGDALVSFVGRCDVQPAYMVDLIDHSRQEKIYSERMLHFISEQFSNDLEKMILRQRIFINALAEEIIRIHPQLSLTRRGNDLYEGEGKLNVSIATSSPVSTLFHVGINISSRNTPVPTKGLEDYRLQPQPFAERVMARYLEDLKDIEIARAKVKAVP